MAEATANLREVAPGQYELDLNIPAGEKGEPGGFVTGILLEDRNLNDVVSPGLYRQVYGSKAIAQNNYPRVGNGGVMMVQIMTVEYLVQTYEPLTGNALGQGVVYRRAKNGATWTPWRTYSSQRVDETAGRAIYTWDEVNNREQLVYGDTGWRDVKASIIAPYTAGSLLIRRVGSRVTLKWDGLNSGSDTPAGKGFYGEPAGFVMSSRDPLYYGNPHIEANTSASGTLWAFGKYASGITAKVTLGAHSSTHYYNGGISYLTDNTWPAVLPGTAVGTIPNS